MPGFNILMRRKVTPETLRQFMKDLAAAARSPGNVYFTGGTTALLLGFRNQTIDIDLKFDPEPIGVFEAIAVLKNRLDLNVELASPGDFIPVAHDWRTQSQHIVHIGLLDFFHFDFSMQALSKIERGLAQDLADATRLVSGKHVTVLELRRRFLQIEPELLRYPAIDPGQFCIKLERFLDGLERSQKHD